MKLSNGVANSFNRDVNIYIDDTDIVWKNGQVYRIVIDSNFPMDMYTLGSYDLAIFTDAKDRSGNGQSYGVEIGRIYSTDFYAANGAPRIEVICIDAKNYIFTYDLKY